MPAFLLVSGTQSGGRALLTFSNWNESGSGSIAVDRIELELVQPKKHGSITPIKPIRIESGRDTTVDLTETLTLMLGDVAQSEICVTVKGSPADAFSAKTQIFMIYQFRGYFHAFQFDRQPEALLAPCRDVQGGL